MSSVNPVVGETNDGWLNDIRKRALTRDHALFAIRNAAEGPAAEGAIGAGTGVVAFGWKGGIGASSRVLQERLGGYIVGAPVQSNFSGVLQMAGIPLGQMLGQYYLKDDLDECGADGSIMMVVATDTPLSDRNLARLARRGLAGLARTGAAMSSGSGDYTIAFSTHPDVRRTPERQTKITAYPELSNSRLSLLFLAAIEAAEEDIYNSLCMAHTVSGFRGVVEALPLSQIRAVRTSLPPSSG